MTLQRFCLAGNFCSSYRPGLSTRKISLPYLGRSLEVHLRLLKQYIWDKREMTLHPDLMFVRVWKRKRRRKIERRRKETAQGGERHFRPHFVRLWNHRVSCFLKNDFILNKFAYTVCQNVIPFRWSPQVVLGREDCCRRDRSRDGYGYVQPVCARDKRGIEE